MSVWGLILLTLGDIALTLALSRFVFRDLVAGWQFWGALLYAAFVGGSYYELIGGQGFVPFALEEFSLFEYVVLVIFSLLMTAFHFWALKIW
ncbi:hypothetical protein P5705_19320 [Pseudomonas entomophila]|uniref:hypothetical protein n=1 Tax=Pseudomonas entomophila TaxID=312306 RepID=UPI00240539DD|nr:hypothetical protein [Pseudomonas entomophila]MDF9619804.1 hypothetical protein [Pseudomonas entomophila]